MSEILPNVHRIESIFGGRWLASYLLVGERALLVDSGFQSTATEIILPYLRHLGLSVAEIQWLVVTHASGDHFGGNGVLKECSPTTTIVAHEQDAGSIASHSTFLAEHLSAFRADGIPVPEMQPADPAFLALHGPEVAVDWAVRGGEYLSLSATWTVELVYLPGHTPGHLAVYDPVNQALFAGDAVMGSGIPDTQGRLVMPPHYFEVDWYLGSIERARRLGPQYFLATHYPPLADQAVPAFLDASETFVSQFDAVVLALLEHANEPLDMPALIAAARDHLGIPEADYQYGLLLRAHLRQFLQQGRVVVTCEAGRKRWALAAR